MLCPETAAPLRSARAFQVAFSTLALSLVCVEPQAAQAAAHAPGEHGFVASKSVVFNRSRQITNFVNPDGSRTAVISDNAVNYQDSNGTWHAIDNHIVPDAKSGGFRSTANAWEVHFGSTVDGVSVSTARGGLTMTPTTSAKVAPVVTRTDNGIQYADVWPGADLRYQVTSNAVKESVMIKTPTAGSSFAFSLRSGAHVSNPATLLSRPLRMSPQIDGSVLTTGLDSSGLRIGAPLVLRADGAPVEAAHARLRVETGKVVLSVDPAWLAAQPASAFPINLDPSVFPTPNTSTSYKTDGFTCSNCGIQFGNAVDGGNTYWRTVAHFPYESLFGDEILGAQFNTGWQGGTQNAYSVNAYWASAYSFSGAKGHPTVLASGTPGGTTGTITGAALTAQIKSWADSRISNGAFGFVGTETSTYTYQTYSVNLAITYDLPPSAPTAVGFNAAAPSTPACTGGAIDGTQASSWKATLSAPTARNLYAIYRWWDAATPATVHTAKTGTYARGSTNSLAWIVAWAPNVFANGHTYGWNVQGYDGLKAGPASGNCSFRVSNPVATAPTNPGFGPSSASLPCGSSVRGDLNIVLDATIKAATAQSQVRAVFAVSYTDAAGVVQSHTYTSPYVAYQAAGSLAQATIAPNTSAAGTYSIPKGTSFTWTVKAQTASDSSLSPATNCSGATNANQLPAPSLQSADLDSGNGGVDSPASVTLSDSEPTVTGYVWSYQQTLPSPLPSTCPTAPADNFQGVGLACSTDGPDQAGNEWNVIQVIPPRTSFSLTVWAIDTTGTVSLPTTVAYTVADVTGGTLTHLWQTDNLVATSTPSSVTDAVNPDPATGTPLGLTSNTAGAILTSGGAPWQNAPGSSGTALHFDGTSGKGATAAPAVPTNRSDDHWQTADNFSMQVWVRPQTDASGEQTLPAMSQGSGALGLDDVFLGIVLNRWGFCMYDHAAPQLEDCAYITPAANYLNQWTLLTGVWDATAQQVRLYVSTNLTDDPNFLPITSSASAAHSNPIPDTGPMAIGSGDYFGSEAHWYGDIEDPMTYQGVLSGDSVAATAASGPYNPANPQ